MSNFDLGEGIPAMHADFSTSAVALGKITMAKEAGEAIPLGWAVDADGQPTTDPVKALEGALVSAADYKGWALGLMVEALAAGLTGSAMSFNTKGLKRAEGPPHDLGQVYILIDPNAHGGDFAGRFELLAAEVASEPGVRIPGASRRTHDPVDVPDALWAKVEALAEGAAA